VDNFINLFALAEYNIQNSEKYAFLILILLTFTTVNEFQDFYKNSKFFAVFATPFLVDIIYYWNKIYNVKSAY